MTKPDWIKPANDIKQEELEKIKIKASQQVESAYQSTLSLFTWNNTTWDARDQYATLLRDLLNRIANGQGLPNSKTTITLRDKIGAKHDLTEAEVIDLGKAGSDHRDSCLDKRLDYLEQVNEASTVDEINTIVDNMDWEIN